MIILPAGSQEKPPLLQMYILPSGPSAAPFGPPGILATISFRPSGYTRVSRAPRISTSTTEPSGITTGPSGNSRSVARTRTSDILASRRLVMACTGDVGPHARFARGYDKVAPACQASGRVCQRCAVRRDKIAHRALDRRLSMISAQTRSAFGARENCCALCASAALRVRIMLLLHRHPDLEAAIAGLGIELFVIALEVRRVRGLQPRGRQPLIPDRVDGAADRGDVVGVGEHRIALLGDADATEAARKVGEIGDLDAGDIVEIAGIITVAADAIG